SYLSLTTFYLTYSSIPLRALYRRSELTLSLVADDLWSATSLAQHQSYQSTQSPFGVRQLCCRFFSLSNLHKSRKREANPPLQKKTARERSSLSLITDFSQLITYNLLHITDSFPLTDPHPPAQYQSS